MDSFTIIDLFWFLFSMISVSLLGVLTWLAQRLVNKTDSIDNKLTAVIVDQAKDKQELRDHLKNDGVHCKDGDCFYRRRMNDELISQTG